MHSKIDCFLEMQIWSYLLAKNIFSEFFCNISCVHRGRVLAIPGFHCFVKDAHSFDALSCEIYIENWVVGYFTFEHVHYCF